MMEYTGPTLHAVVRYHTDRAYGGPEEGGWWYTTYEDPKVVLSTRDEWKAWDYVSRLNTWRQQHGYSWVTYTVVDLPRYRLVPGLMDQACHLDFDPQPGDYELRWDIPEFEPEGRPHYC